MQETAKEKLAESEGQQLLELLCEAVDKMSNASAECTTLEQQLKKTYLEDPSLPRPEITPKNPTMEQKDKTNNILSSYHEKVQSTSLKDARGFPILSKEDTALFKACTLYENWDSNLDAAVDEPDGHKTLRPYVNLWIAGCLKGGCYNYMAQQFNTKENQFDVGGLYAMLIDIIGKVGIHEAHRRVMLVYEAQMLNKETILEFIARLQDMAERVTEIVRDNGDTNFEITTLTL